MLESSSPKKPGADVQKKATGADSPDPLAAEFQTVGLNEITQLFGRRDQQETAVARLGEILTLQYSSEKSPGAKPGPADDRANKPLEAALRLTGHAGQIEEKYGVTVTAVHHRYDYHVKEKGKDITLFSTEATSEGLNQADRKLSEAVAAKERLLIDTYGVRFAHSGESVKSRVPLAAQTQIPVREPTLPELAGVAAALKHSNPSQRLGFDQHGEGIKFYFMTKVALPGATAYVATDADGKKAAFVQPDNRTATEKDDGGSRFSLEAQLTHELAHNLQYKLGWDSNPGYRNAMISALGWKSDSVMEDANGHFYTRSQHTGNDWYRCDDKGQFNIANAQKISNDEMERIAKVRPITNYFPLAIEMFADGVQAYRLSEERRQQLLRESPKLYGIVKQADQTELDMTYGKGQFVRLPGGKIVRNTDANRQLIARFEDGNIVAKN